MTPATAFHLKVSEAVEACESLGVEVFVAFAGQPLVVHKEPPTTEVRTLLGQFR